MLKLSFLSIAMALMAAFSVQGKGLSHYELNVTDFNQLKVTSGINVNYVANPDSAGKAVFDAPSELASVIAFIPNKNKLTIEFTTKGEKYENLPTITVYSRYLTLAENQGDSLLRLTNVAPGPEIKLRVMGRGRLVAHDLTFNEVSASITTGSGQIVVSGKCSVANLTSYSVGNIQADKLQADIVKCKLVGTGEIGCWPVEELSVQFSGGSGNIYYRGEPKKIKNRSFNIKVRRIEED